MPLTKKQKPLDKNKNGKIDGEDFKMMNKKAYGGKAKKPVKKMYGGTAKKPAKKMMGGMAGTNRVRPTTQQVKKFAGGPVKGQGCIMSNRKR